VGGAYIAIGLSAPQRAGPRAAIDGSGGQRPSGSARVDRRRLRPDPGPHRSDDPVVVRDRQVSGFGRANDRARQAPGAAMNAEIMSQSGGVAHAVQRSPSGPGPLFATQAGRQCAL